MKKNIYLLIIVTVLLLSGCKKQAQMVDFIPTPTPVVTNEDEAGEESENTNEATPTPKTIHVGQTIAMYVKLDEYGAFLNVRSNPSKDGAIVGSLVHTEKIDVIEIVDGWASFEMDNVIVYVSADFLVPERPDYIPLPTAAPTPTPTPKPKDNTPKDTPTPEPDAAPPEI